MITILFVSWQISSNGLISFGSSFTAFSPFQFPILEPVVAPYWDDITLVLRGAVRYGVISRREGSNVNLLNKAEEFVSERQGISFQASWMLVAKWDDVCAVSNVQCDLVSVTRIRQTVMYRENIS